MVRGMCGREHACVAGGVHGGGHAWQGVCMVGMCMVEGVHGGILRDTVNERAVRILLECILV